jgi:molybdopterin-guanine dinucleotide biosynthesis protein B
VRTIGVLTLFSEKTTGRKEIREVTILPDLPIVSIVGFSGSGKTTFIEKLIPQLIARNIRVGTLKHDVHGFEMDKPGKDSWRHKRAGAAVTVISSPGQIGMVKDVDHDHDPDELKPLFKDVQIILAEGYKSHNKPKLEIFRQEIREKPFCEGDDALIGLISDVSVDLGVPRFLLDDAEGVAEFLISYFKLLPGCRRDSRCRTLTPKGLRNAV